MHITFASTTQTFTNGTGADAVLLTTTESSAYVFVQNNTGSDLKLRWAAATGTSADIILATGDVLEYVGGFFMPVGALHVNGANGTPITWIHK
jgi:hypothetical protein